MRLRTLCSTVLTTTIAMGALIAIATPSQAAVFTPTTALYVQNLNDGSIGGSIDPNISTISVNSAIGACNFIASGPSTNPSSTPFHIEGNATVVTTSTVAATELSCWLTSSAGASPRMTLELPGYTSAVAGDINVNSFGPYSICTMVNVHYTNGDESNNAETPVCRALTGIA